MEKYHVLNCSWWYKSQTKSQIEGFEGIKSQFDILNSSGGGGYWGMRLLFAKMIKAQRKEKLKFIKIIIG